MKKMLSIIAIVIVSLLPAHGNTPGRHTVALQWQNGTCTTAGTCSTNIYRGTTANVCAGTPTPIASVPVSGTGANTGTFTDTNPPTGAVFYNVSNVDPAKGGESTCNGEVQVSVQAITTAADTGLTAAVQ